MKKTILFLFALMSYISILNSQVGIGTQTPDGSAALDVSATDKGVLLNEVDITSKSDIATIPDTQSNMMVYSQADHNVGTDEEVLKDYMYFFDGTNWLRVFVGDELDAEIDKLKIPEFGMYAYSKAHFQLAVNTNAIQDIIYAPASTDEYLNPAIFERVNDTTFRALQDGVYMMDSFINLVQNSGDISWGVKMLTSTDNGATWSPVAAKANYCNHSADAGNTIPTSYLLQEAFTLNANDLIKLIIFQRSGTVNTTARLHAVGNPLRYSSGFKIIYYPF